MEGEQNVNEELVEKDCGNRDWFNDCSLRDHACIVCRVWGRNARRAVAGTFGMASFMVALGMILFVVIYDRSQIHIGTVLYQIVYSACVDLFANCHIYSRYVWVNFLIMLLGVILFAVGTGLYASASLGRGSYEAVTFALAEKNNWQVKIVRMILDIVMVVVGVLLGGKFGICTIVTVIISGPVIHLVNARSKQLFKM